MYSEGEEDRAMMTKCVRTTILCFVLFVGLLPGVTDAAVRTCKTFSSAILRLQITAYYSTLPPGYMYLITEALTQDVRQLCLIVLS